MVIRIKKGYEIWVSKTDIIDELAIGRLRGIADLARKERIANGNGFTNRRPKKRRVCNR